MGNCLFRVFCVGPVFVTFLLVDFRCNTEEGFMMNILTSWTTTSASLVPLKGVLENGQESGKPPADDVENHVMSGFSMF